MASAAEQASYGAAPKAQSERRLGSLRRALERLVLRRGPQKITGSEYQSFGLNDPAIPFFAKRTFAGEAASNALNAAVSPIDAASAQAIMADKLACGLLFDRIGLPTTQTQAILCPRRQAGDVPVLRDAAQLEAFLRNDALFPLFCKSATGGGGAARLECIDGNSLSLGNGETWHASLWADEIASRHRDGFLLQTALDPHPQIVKMVGRSVSSVRLVTAVPEAAPKLAYAIWRLPAWDTMSDNLEHPGSLIALLCGETGQVLKCRDAQAEDADWIRTHPVTGASLTGYTLPFWEEAVKLAQNVHAFFPRLGLCATDIAIGPGGPYVLSCETAPAHALYQRASGRGIWNEDLAPIWNAVIARQKRAVARGKQRG